MKTKYLLFFAVILCFIFNSFEVPNKDDDKKNDKESPVETPSKSPVEVPVVDSLSVTSIAAVKPNEAYVLNHINFEFNSFQLLPSSFAQLDFLVSVLKKNPQWKIQLNGHTDDQGSDDYNLTLSANRATSVGEYIQQHGVSSERIQTRGFGKQKPLLAGNDEQTRAINRRVEVKFIDH